MPTRTQMLRRSVLLALLLVFSLPACGPPYTVVRQAAPNPMVDAPLFTIEALHWEGVRVGRVNEEEYLLGNERRAEQYLEARRELEVAMVHAVMHRESGMRAQEAGVVPPREGFIVRAQVIRFEPDYSRFAAVGQTWASLRVEVLDLQGRVLDEFTVRRAIDSGEDSRLPMRAALLGTQLGQVIGQYLEDRRGPGR